MNTLIFPKETDLWKKFHSIQTYRHIYFYKKSYRSDDFRLTYDIYTYSSGPVIEISLECYSKVEGILIYGERTRFKALSFLDKTPEEFLVEYKLGKL